MNLPKGHLSPSQMNAWEMCEVRYRIFNVEGAKSPPDFVLHAKQKTHWALLEKDLAQKIESHANLANSDISEIYRAEMESGGMEAAKEDPNLEGEPQKAVEAEVTYFDKIILATEKWRKATNPMEVEKSLSGNIGGVPVECRIDLVHEEPIGVRVEDLKRQGGSPADPSKSQQLTTYSILTDLDDVALSVIKENKTPTFESVPGIISKGQKSRTIKRYQDTAEKIMWAMEKDRWTPVDHGDTRKSWICTAKFCGAWKRDARDWVSGRIIACPWGERSQVQA